MFLGDKQLGETFDFTFNTVRDTGAPHTLAGTPTLAAYLGNSTTQITTGLTLTVDFDGVTGMHHVRVDLSSGYARYQDVRIVIAAGTVNSVSVVGAVIATFSIEKAPAPGLIARGRAQASTTNTLQIAAAESFGDDALQGALVHVREASGGGRKQTRMIASNAGSTDTVTVDPDWSPALSGDIDYEILAAPPAAETSLPDVNTKTVSANALTAAAAASDLASELNSAVLSAIGALNDIDSTAAQNAAAAALAAYNTTGVAKEATVAQVGTYVDTEVASLTTSLASLTSAIATINGYLDTEIAAIKAKTDQFAFTTTNKVDAHVLSMGTDSVSAAALATAAVTKIRDSLLNWVVFTGYSLAKIFRIKGILDRGTTTGRDGNTEVYTAPAGGETVTVQYDDDGNRIVVSDTVSGTP